MSEGCYLLCSNLVGMDAATLWRRYIQLTEAKWAFRITKDELSIRPIWQQTADRVKAHILLCFLTYVMWKTLAAGCVARAWGTRRARCCNDLAKIKSSDVVLPACRADGELDRTVRT